MTGSVRSVRQAFAVLRLLAESGPHTLSEVGRMLDLSPSSCFNLLRTLESEGIAEREARTKRYRLTRDWAAASVFQDARAQAVIDRMRPAMVRFAKEFSATVGLWKVATGRRLLLIGHAESDGALRIQLADGQRQPLAGGAVGRALAAAQDVDEAEVARRFSEVRWHRPLSLQGYLADVEQARRHGYAIDNGMGFAGVCSVAAILPADLPMFLLSASIFADSRGQAEIRAMGKALASLGQRADPA